MADDKRSETGDKQGSQWPLPKFFFSVELGEDKTVAFQEITGLDAEAQIIEYRHGNDPVFSTMKMPGLKKFGNITCKKGIFVSDQKIFNWFNEIKMNTIKRRNIIISLLDEEGHPTMVWTLTNAWPTKITGTDMKSDGNEVAVESLEIAHEGLTIVNK